MSSLDLSHLVNDVLRSTVRVALGKRQWYRSWDYLDCAREDMVFGEVLESAPLDVAHRVTARNL